jgi:alkylation response protein AidB-like acyl-CoA dehydrogenase
MNFGLTETQQTLKKTTRQFLTAECPSAEVRRLMETDTAFDAPMWNKMAEQGWTGIIFPEEYGGIGMGMVEMAAVLEEMGRALLPGPFLSTVLLAGSAIAHAGNEAQKQHYLKAICEGRAKATLALLEEGASWSADSVHLHASPSATGYVLAGRKLFVPDAAIADFIVCAARLRGELALFIVPSATHGVNIKATPAIDSTRKLYEGIFDHVALPETSLLALGDRAEAAVENAVAVSTVGLVAEMVGGMQRLLDITVEYAKTRKQFGRPIGQFQAVQHMCADMLLMTESSRSAVYYAAWAMSEDESSAPAAVSVAKAYASDAYREVGNRAIQVHGGMGFTWENDVHLYYRRAKASEIAFGDATWHRERLARRVIDRQPVNEEDEVAAVVV